ncbi:hypothetical protein BH20ACI3_BH20ACI3_22440 [soil metagenome]
MYSVSTRHYASRAFGIQSGAGCPSTFGKSCDEFACICHSASTPISFWAYFFLVAAAFFAEREREAAERLAAAARA